MKKVTLSYLIKVRTRITVVRVPAQIGKAVLLCIGFKDTLLESGLSRGDYPNYIFFECVNYPLSICSDGRQ